MGFAAPLHCEQAAAFPHDVQGPAGSGLLPSSPGLWQLDGFVSTCSPRLSLLRYAGEGQVSSKLSALAAAKNSSFFVIWSHPLRVFLSSSAPHTSAPTESRWVWFSGGLVLVFFPNENAHFLKPSKGNPHVANPMDLHLPHSLLQLLWPLEKGLSKSGSRDQNASERD